MKSLTCLLLLAIAATASADTVLYPRGCIWVSGRCQRECEVGTISYPYGCGDFMPEATCAEPNPEPEIGKYMCDFTECYCAPPTVRDPKTKECVPLSACSK